MPYCEYHLDVIDGSFKIPKNFRALLQGDIALTFVPEEGYITGCSSSMSPDVPANAGTFSVAADEKQYITIPPTLMKLARITDAVVLVAVERAGGYFEIWSENLWQRELNLCNKVVEHWQSVIARAYVID